MTKKKESHPWDRMKGESRQAYQAFRVYLRLGPLNRSLAATGRELGKSTTLMSRWSARWSWVERTEAHDHMAQVREDEAILRARERKAVEKYLSFAFEGSEAE